MKWLLTDLLLQSLEAYQIFFLSLMDLAGGFIGCGCFCADHSIGPAAALGDVRQVAFVALNDLMQMPATLFTYGKTMDGLVGIGHKAAQFAAVAAAACEVGRSSIVGGFFRDLSDARFERRSALGQPPRDRVMGLGQLTDQPRFKGEERGEMRVGQVIHVVARESVVDQPGKRLVGSNGQHRFHQWTEQRRPV